MPDRIRLIEVAVGMPAELGVNRDGVVLSGIGKRMISGDSVMVRHLNIDGDGQADLRVHGGLDKAIYCYPREHRGWWKVQTGYARSEAPFGENLSIEGVTEEDVCIGDTWRWGGALLQVSQPRWPCFKLAMHSGRPTMVKEFVASGRSGWYLRVLEEGRAPVRGEIAIETRDPLGISVAQAFRANRGDLSPEEAVLVYANPALANAWRR